MAQQQIREIWNYLTSNLGIKSHEGKKVKKSNTEITSNLTDHAVILGICSGCPAYYAGPDIIKGTLLVLNTLYTTILRLN